jgi:hypothetical protein
VTPPALRLTTQHGAITIVATDAGSGVDPTSIAATLDGRTVKPTYANGQIRIPAAKGRHTLSVTVADYQETKNMEDVAPVLPNTTTLRRVVRVP